MSATPHRARSLRLFALILLAISCVARAGAEAQVVHPQSAPAATRAAMQRIILSDDGKRFILADSKQPFIPWGFNYDRDYKSRLIEEYWDKDWETLAGDFREMKSLGASVVRVHFSVAHFMDAPDKPSQHALAQLSRLLDLCEELDLYLDVTGLGCYRKEDVPAWYQNADETERWQIQARFWDAVSATCARSPAVAWYDLMNEPIVPGQKRDPGDWLTGHLADFWYCQFITLDPAGRDRSDIARKWIETLTAPIRRRDPHRLVSLGMLPNSLPDDAFNSGFFPEKVAPLLDFLCVHLYPGKPPFAKDLKTLAGFDVGKPLVIEETFPLGCTADELVTFLKKARPPADGVLSFYWGQTPDELKKSGTMKDAIIEAWLRRFTSMNHR